ncbi:MFS transporter [Angustibacter sp. McL0619]|uniref:MFS transporter n=1 Tax=Angustibacter sp. McL0619 TaxID=3415676 RepID=UPI003CECD46C
MTTTQPMPQPNSDLSAHAVQEHGNRPGPLTHDEPDEQRRTWTVAAIALVAQVLVVLDISVVNTALPSIGADLHLTGAELQWLVTAYLMMSGGGLLLGGRIADLLSRKVVFLVGLAVFTVASILSGLADTATQLTLSRAGQGLAAALLTPAALSIISTAYSGRQRRTGLALWGAVGSLGVAAGVLLGGALTTWLGWQAIFFINAPIGAAAFIAGISAIPANAPVKELASTTQRAYVSTLRRFDIPGAVTVIGGLVALIYGLGASGPDGWGSAKVLVALAVSAVLFTAFIRIENRAAAPLFPPHTWKVRTLVTGTAVMLAVTGILVGTVFLTSIYLQTVLGFSALQAGLAFLPFALAITGGTLVARHALAHGSPRAVSMVGLVVTGAGAVLLSRADASSAYGTGILPALLVIGVGVGAVFVPVSVTAMAGIPPQHAGMASGFLMTGHEVGAALGVAVLSAIATSAGTLTTAGGAANGFTRGLLAAATIAGVAALLAFWRMPATRVTGPVGHMHH